MYLNIICNVNVLMQECRVYAAVDQFANVIGIFTLNKLDQMYIHMYVYLKNNIYFLAKYEVF